MAENYLLVPDLQIPFEHPKALEHCLYLQRHYKIKKENIYCLGDELDQLYGGLYKKDPNANLSAMTEIMISHEKLKAWYAAFPICKIVISNHGTRWFRKAFEAEIPSVLLRKYEEVIEAPKSWVWQKRFIVEGSKQKFIVEHGDDWGGQTPAAKAALHYGMSFACGHHHSKMQIIHQTTALQKTWSMVTGCLIDFDSYAFNYARAHSHKPVIGAGVVLNGGTTPIFHTIE